MAAGFYQLSDQEAFEGLSASLVSPPSTSQHAAVTYAANQSTAGKIRAKRALAIFSRADKTETGERVS